MKPLRIAINGFGRIGRCIFRALLASQRNDVEVVVINAGFGDIHNHLHLLKYDSTHGILPGVQYVGNNMLAIHDKQIPILLETDPARINWRQYQVDIVMECSGVFTNRDAALQHIVSGAKKVMISAPANDVDKTIVYGVNEHNLTASDRIISIGSCTTNCLAPVAKVLNDTIGIESGFMTTIHSYTNDQKILDAIHVDRRRARAAALSMVPSSTGAAKALGLVLPELSGRLDGVSIRVPTQNVSMIDLKFIATKKTSILEINERIKEACEKHIGLVLAYTDEELVSIDFNHNDKSATFDTTQTRVTHGNFCRVAAWYDNEWGFSNRMLDVAALYGVL